MEILEIVSEITGQPTGVCLSRAEVLEQHAWCRSTNVFVLNSKGEVLCHQRSFNKERLPGIWLTHVGGHVGLGETFESNALKELHEEAGIKTTESALIPWRTTPVKDTSRVKGVRLWMRDFVTLCDIDIADVIPQPSEVEQFKWKSFSEIVDDERRNPQVWNAGVHDFRVEYYCLRAALMAAHATGGLALPTSLHVWQPIHI